MWDSIANIFNSIGSFLEDLVVSALGLLPDSPIVFLQTNAKISELLGYVNYFIPFYAMVSILEVWLTSIIGYYAISLLLRWIKAVS